jgi:predicted PurR-regulated permease PerM
MHFAVSWSMHHDCSRSTETARALRWATVIFTLGALVVMAPFWAPLLLATWVAIVTAPVCNRIARRFHAQSGAPAFLTVVLVLIVLLPIVFVALSLAVSLIDLVHNLRTSHSGSDVLQKLTSRSGGVAMQGLTPEKAFDFVRAHASSALHALSVVSGAVTQAVLGLVIFVAAYYLLLAKGAALYVWLIEHSPLAPQHTRRLGAAFAETGRGLLIGIGLTALLQGAVSTVGYVITGVPQAFVLGLLTVIAAFIPSVGSALVWVPVTAALFISGRTVPGVIMLAIGAFASTVDNIARPLLSRFGKLNLNGLVLFIAMLGGIAIFGAWGLMLGPLCVRLATESLELVRESRESREAGES